MHEAVFEDCFGDARDAVCGRHQRHQLCLHVGREAGIGFGRDVDAGVVRAVARDAQAAVRGRNLYPGGFEQRDDGADRVASGADEFDFAAGRSDGHRVGARFDAVGDHRVAGAMQAIDAFDDERARIEAGNFRAHRLETEAEVGDLRLHGGVLEHGRALGQAGGHHQVFGGTDGDEGEVERGAAQATRRFGNHIAAVDLDLRTHGLKALNVQVDGACADGAAAGERHLRFVTPREKRSNNEEACAHFAHEIIGRLGRGDVLGVQFQDAADFGFGVTVAVHRETDA